MGKTILKLLRKVGEELLDIIYPREEKCIICQTEGFVGICDYCRSKIKNVNLANKRSYFLWVLRWYIKKINFRI